MGRTGTCVWEDEAYTLLCMVIWAMAMKTQGFISDKKRIADRDSLGTQFLLKAVAAPARLLEDPFQTPGQGDLSPTRKEHGGLHQVLPGPRPGWGGRQR